MKKLYLVSLSTNEISCLNLKSKDYVKFCLSYKFDENYLIIEKNTNRTFELINRMFSLCNKDEIKISETTTKQLKSFYINEKEILDEAEKKYNEIISKIKEIDASDISDSVEKERTENSDEYKKIITSTNVKEFNGKQYNVAYIQKGNLLKEYIVIKTIENGFIGINTSSKAFRGESTQKPRTTKISFEEILNKCAFIPKLNEYILKQQQFLNELSEKYNLKIA